MFPHAVQERLDQVSAFPEGAVAPPDGAVAAAQRPRPVARLLDGHRGKWAALVALLFALGTLGAYLGARSLAHSEGAKSRLQFHLFSAQIASTLQLAIQREEDLTVGGSAFIARNEGSSAAGFDRWAESVRALQRYPELESIGFVVLVGRSELRAFEARMRTSPLLPFGRNRRGVSEPFGVLPPGTRPSYCFAKAGITRNHATFEPAGLDYCALAPSLMTSRETGRSSYAPFIAANTTLGVQTPIYRGGHTPSTVAGRRREFVGWLGELLEPGVLVNRALQGHPTTAATVRYVRGSTHVAFTSGRPERGTQSARINLHNGWTVQTFGAGPDTGVLHGNAALLLFGGAAISLLLSLLVFELGTSRMRALSLVREKTSELTHQALHDTLTGLPNRALVLDRAAQLLARTARQPELLAGALYVDVDGFKYVNDNLGHAAGDELLRVVGARLQATVREQDTVGRLGGDEFVVLVETQSLEAPVEVLAERVIEALHRPVRIGEGNRTYSFTASVGVATGKYASSDELLRDADLALYAAKSAGKDRYVLFDASMRSESAGLELDLELSEALWEEQLFLEYQPVFDLARGSVVAAEALLRWRHPQRGVVPFGEFAHAAEESGLIAPIGRWVLQEACRRAAAWRAAGHDLGVSVNVSAGELAREEFCAEVRAALAQSGIEPSALTLEVTETTMMREVTIACERLEEIKSLGVSVAIDDFGTGYTSLAHLQRMPADILKVDASFVAALGDGGQSRALLEAVLGVARALELGVVAEGVETQEQLDTLRELGCEMAQGYLLARPGPAELLGMLRDGGAPHNGGTLLDGGAAPQDPRAPGVRRETGSHVS